MAEIKEPIESYGLSKKDKKRSLFSKIGVVGCGRDGRFIVNLIALSGIEVVFIEVSQEKIDYAMGLIERNLDTKIENWGLTQSEKRATTGRISGSLDYNDLKDCDFVIECIRYTASGKRSTELRKEVFRKLEEILSPDAIIATNATTVIISELAAEMVHKERCVSLHFPIASAESRLLEVVKGTFTSAEVLDKIYHFAHLIRYSIVEVRESNGLVALRLMAVMLNESCQILMESLTCLESIDEEYRIVFGQRYGIFELADIMGIEKLVMLMEDMFNEYGDKKYKAHPVLWRMYYAKQYGLSNGRGFYVYDAEGRKTGPNNLI